MNIKVTAALLAILAIFVIHAVSLNFTQDDAFISYRYVKNLVNGHGLVFNPGERVEGYTNFLWIILLSIFANFGLDIIIVSKILGVASGCITLFLLYKISFLFLQNKTGTQHSGFFALLPCLLLASNSAFAYWSISGLETAFFVMAVLSSVYLYFINERLAIISSALSSLIRPEGVLVFSILLAHKFFFKRQNLKECLLYTLGFTLLLLPFLFFKLSYYGDLLPSPFYAKTGLSWEYLKTGLAYFWLFLRHYGLWGVLYLIPILLYKDLQVKGKLFLLMIYTYTLYIIIIGGDVLRVHRFFLPILPLLYLLFVYALVIFSLRQKRRVVKWFTLIFPAIAFSSLTFFLPRPLIMDARQAEIALCFKMSAYAQRLTQCFGAHFTLSISTIGAISYLTEATVIDMLGLTDPYIAKHPEKIPGVISIWKEKNFNTQYLLSRNPDVIMFSTGKKPSAPAEKALFLSSRFRENYYSYYFLDVPMQFLFHIFKRKGEYTKKNEIFPDVRFVDLYNEAVISETRGDLQTCVDKLEEVLEIGPKDFAWAYDFIASCHFRMGNTKKAKEYAQKAIALDDYCIMSHVLLRQVYFMEGDTAAALQEEDKLLLYNPETKIR